MKIIKTPKAMIIRVFDEPSEIITPDGYEDFMTPIYQNKLTILTCAFAIESLLEQWISDYFFRDAPRSDRRDEFMSQILASDWCSFGAKRRLVLNFVNADELLQGKEKNDYDNLLRKCMSYRNAFAHGALSTDGRKVELRYFEGSPKKKFIDDEWLQKIEDDLTLCFRLTFKLSTGLDFDENQPE